MAEAAVALVKLSLDLIVQSPGLDFGVGHQVSKIKKELESMKSFLRDAERCKDRNESLCNWVTQVTEAALKAEDMTDEYLYHLYRAKKRGFKGYLLRALGFPMEMWRRHCMVQEFKELRHDIEEIAERSRRYDLSQMEEDPSNSHHDLNYAQNVRDMSFFVNHAEVVGFREENDQMLKRLTEGERELTIVSVVGMGGSGTTTLVAHAYNNPLVKKSFNCFAWVSVSQNYVIEDLLRKIFKEFSKARLDVPSAAQNTKNYKELLEIIVDFLKDKRYLIVLDDVWDSHLWKPLSAAFLDQKNGSRVIITTRNEGIASYPFGAGSHVVHCKPLSRDEAWALFCRKAFGNEACPPQLEDTASALVGKCGGLPLAILTLGGLMASKDRTELKWKEVSDSLNWHISDNPMLDDIKTILLLSFKELPYFLKNCFLYCCCFPIEHWIGAGRLIRMWMAEGFLEEKKGLSPEEVGKIYLNELISRNLLQVEQPARNFRSKLCKLHGMMWGIAHSVAEREHFLSVCKPHDLEAEITPRRLSLHAVESTVDPGHDMKYVRTFSAFKVKHKDTLPLDNLVLKFRLLRVLELIGSPIDNLPKQLGNLFNLRYLGLKRTKISELPTSIGRLRYLKTLDIRRTQITELPKEIKKLRNLRHLLIYCADDDEQFFYIRRVAVPKSIVKLKHLQVVNCLEANPVIVKRIGELSELRRLQLTNLKEGDGKDLCLSIEKMKDLRHLMLMTANENEYLQLEHLSSTSLVLKKLTLVGRLRDVPEWFGLLRNVVYLHLHWSQLNRDPIPCISKLPVLERLVLISAFSHDKKQLHFNSGFSRLADLTLGHFPEVVEIVISGGVMTSLIQMNIYDCAKLKRVPLGIEHLRDLQSLHMENVSEELISGIKDEGVDFLRVKHIPRKVY